MKRYRVHIDGKSYEVDIEELGDSPRQASPTAAVNAADRPPAPSSASPRPAAPQASAPPQTGGAKTSAGSDTITAPMPGTILRIAVATGDRVEKGDTLLILEAMKMENEILAPHSGSVAQVHVASGASVNAGDILLSLAS
jgi:biotin carboxyl carrier protein